MVIRIITCPICKEKLNSFYVCSGVCPVCKSAFNSARQKVSNTGLRQLRADKREYKKNTMTRGQIKTMFKLTKEQIIQIPCTNEFGEKRYYKKDVANFISKS